MGQDWLLHTSGCCLPGVVLYGFCQVLREELGPDWRQLVAEFDYTPLAAASIGQVHGVITHDGRRGAMKIQYPGVARSIESDVGEE